MALAATKDAPAVLGARLSARRWTQAGLDVPFGCQPCPLIGKELHSGRRAGNRVDQPARVGVLWPAHHLFRRALFDDLAKIEDVDPVDDLADNGKIVGDEQVREPELILKALEQVEDLRLDGNVERGNRLIAYEDFWG